MSLIAELSSRYRVWFCDIWGVVHDGVVPFEKSVAGLRRHRQGGGIVILVSNSPRTADGVARQLAELSVDPASYNAIVTSGDVTRALITSHGGHRINHLGPTRDLSIFAGLDVSRVDLDDAESVLCTGLLDELHETPADYDEILRRMVTRQLVMICANPDKVVRKGDHIVPCAGALADRFAALGGSVLMAGKPYAPIYDLALAHASRIAGRPVSRAEVLAIGDGPDTDIKGAAGYGLATLLVADGVTDARHGLEAVRREVKHMVPEADLVAAVHDLSWDGP